MKHKIICNVVVAIALIIVSNIVSAEISVQNARVDETMHITTDVVYDSVEIVSPYGSYQLIGEGQEISFVPKRAGEYTIKIYYVEELVEEKTVLIETNIKIVSSGTKIILPAGYDIEILDDENKYKKSVEVNEEFVLKDEKKYVIRYFLDDKLEKEEAYYVEPGQEIPIETATELGRLQVNTKKSVPQLKFEPARIKIKNEQLDALRIIELQGNYTNASLKVRPIGNKIYKCSNYVSGSCKSSWEFYSDANLEELNLEFTEHVAYAELGVVTINSIKAAYEPFETAEFITAILDSGGYLTDPEFIEGYVMSPSGIKTDITDSFVRNYYGIWNSNYSIGNETGIYEIRVNATGNKVNNNLINTFLVSYDFAYDIIRNVPASIDPFAGSFYDNFTILSHHNSSEYVNVTEIIPSEFDIIRAYALQEGEKILANINTDAENHYLQWNNTRINSSFVIEAEAPMITPALFYLGPIQANEYVEPRRWALAIDPTPQDDSISVNDSALYENELLTLTGTFSCTGGGQAINFDLFPEDDAAEIVDDNSCTNKDFEWVSTNVDSCSGPDSCTASGTSARVTISKCKNGNTLGVTWTLKACGTNEPLQSSNELTFDTNIANNFDLSTTVTIDETPDTTPPTISLGNPEDDSFSSTASNTFYYTPTDNKGFDSCTVVLNDVYNASNSTSINNNTQNSITTTLDDNNYLWTVNCTDTSGNEGTNTTLKNITVDTTNPTTVNLVEPENNAYIADLTPLFDWSQTTETNFVNYSLLIDDNSDFSSPEQSIEITSITTTDYTLTLSLSNLQTYYWKVLVEDKAGRTSDSGSRTFTTDITPPTSLDLVSPSTGTISQDTTPSLDWETTSEDNFANYTIQLDESSDFSSPTLYTQSSRTNSTYQIGAGEALSPNQLYYWRVIAYDLANNIRYSSSNYTYETDNAAPSVSINYPTAGYYSTANLDLNYTVSDQNIDSCWYTVDGGSKNILSACNNDSITLSEGSRTVRVYANDTASNQANDIVTITIDLTNPTVNLIDPEDTNYQTSKPFDLNYTPTDTNLDSCTLYGDFTGSWTSNGTDATPTSGVTNSFTRTYTDGNYEWNIMCTDLSGRTAFAPANYTFTLDTVAPELTLHAPDEAHTEEDTNNIDFNYSVYDATSSIINCSLFINGVYDQKQNSPTESTNLTFIKNLNNDVYNWSITCYDQAGFSTSSEVRNLTVNVVNDFDPPIIVLNYPTEADNISTSTVIFNYTPSDTTGFSNCSIFLDGSLDQTNTTINSATNNYFTINSIPEGMHDYQIECYDNSTNNNYAITDLTNFTIDTIRPSLVRYNPNNITYNTSKDLPLNYFAYDSNALQCYYSINDASNITINSCNNISFNSARGINDFKLYAEDISANTNMSQVYFTAYTNSSLSSFYTPSSASVLEKYGLKANYSDEFGAPILGAQCTITNSLNFFVTEVGNEDGSQANHSSDQVYGSNVLRVDFENITSAAAYDVVLYSHHSTTSTDNLNVYVRCDGSYTPGPSYKVGEILTNESMIDPIFGIHRLEVNNSLITGSDCSILIDSPGNTASEFWEVARINSTFPDNTFLSTDGGSNYNPTSNAFVDVGYLINTQNLTYNASSKYYELNNIHQDSSGIEYANLSCNADYVITRNESTSITINNDEPPRVQIAEITPNPAEFNVSQVNISWAINGLGLSNYYLNLSYPNGSLLTQTQLIPQTLSTSQLSVPGTYTALVYAINSDTFSNQTSDTFTVSDDAPYYYNITNSSASPQVYSYEKTYYFNSSWEDINNNLETVIIQHNFSGSTQNYSVISSTNLYEYNWTTLSGGNHKYRWIGIDANDNTNNSDWEYYVITRDNSSVNLSLNDNGNLTINESEIVNITATTINPPFDNIRIEENGSSLGTGNSPYSILKNYTIPGNYLITAEYDANVNYSTTNKSYYLTVNDVFTPEITLIDPQEGHEDLDGTDIFEFSVTDTGNVANCSLYINGTFNDTKQDPQEDTTLTFTKNFLDGNYNWQIQCEDTAGNTASSEVRNFSVDIRTFQLGLWPTACDDGGACSITTINDSNNGYDGHGNLGSGNNYVYINFSQPNIKPGSTIDWMNISYEKYQETGSGSLELRYWDGDSWDLICNQIFVDSTAGTPDDVQCEFGTYPTFTQIEAGIQLQANFFYSAGSGGKAYETDFVRIYLQYTEDTTPPSVSLSTPENNTPLGAGDIQFKYTPTDSNNNLDNCSIWGDFTGGWEENQTDFGPIDGIINNFTVNLNPGYYTWNVQCVDVANNSNFAENNYTVNITKPDLYVESNGISFSNNNPIESENVTVFGYFENIGFTETGNFTAAFYNGDPDAGGTQINGEFNISYIAGLSNMTINTSFITGIGPNLIFLKLDLTDIVDESSEANNKANNTLNVDSYSYYYGNVSKDLVLSNAELSDLIRFYNITNNTGNLFVADTDDSISFGSLQALGVNKNNINTSNDFDEADTNLGSGNYEDSVATLWSDGNNRPISSRTITAYGQNIDFVPIINSTNNSNFQTGILWDTSADVGDLQYSVDDKEPLVFYSEVNHNKQGAYGTYDLEIRVPALLRNYAAGEDKITFYLELE